MKKSSVVLLTIVAALTFSTCAVQKTAEYVGPPDPVYADQTSDPTRPIVRDTTVTYNYYYRSYFWDNMFRTFFPRRYYAYISQPGYVPHHIRPVRGTYGPHGRSGGKSHPTRGGFGSSGSGTSGHT